MLTRKLAELSQNPFSPCDIVPGLHVGLVKHVIDNCGPFELKLATGEFMSTFEVDSIINDFGEDFPFHLPEPFRAAVLIEENQ